MRNKPDTFGRIDLPHDQGADTITRWTSWWRNFWFTPADPIALNIVRVLSGLVFLAWLLPLAGHIDAFFGMEGWFDREAFRAASRMQDAPVPINWSLLFLTGGNSTGLHVMFWLAIVTFAAFTLGLATRITGVLTWLFVVSFATNPGVRLDADDLLGMLAFYLMIAYLFKGLFSGNLSPREKILGSDQDAVFARFIGKQGRTASTPSLAANLALRVLQVHLALIIFTSGAHKLQFGDWWSGMALWYPLHPPFKTTPLILQGLAAHAQSYAFALSIANYAILAWQLSFPFWAWKQAVRVLLVGGLAIGWIGAAFVYDLPFFGPFFFIAGLAFVSAQEWHTLAARVRGLAGWMFGAGRLQAEKKAPVATRT